MADFEKNKFSLTTVIVVCSGLITLIGYLNARFDGVNEKFDYFEKKYLMAISQQQLINQGTDFRLKILEKTSKKEPFKNYNYNNQQAVLPNNTELKEDDNG